LHIIVISYRDVIKHVVIANCSVLAQHATYACRAYASNMTSVRPSVTLVDFDHIAQQKVAISTWQDRSVSCLLAR